MSTAPFPRLAKYTRLYGNLHVEGLTVLDLGAANGDTAYFFLSRGAARVVTFEAKAALRRSLEAYFHGDYRVESHGAFTGRIVEADVMKMDIEGAERKYHSEELLDYYPQWTVGLHPMFIAEKRYVQLVGFLTKRGAYYLGSDGPFEGLYSTNPPLGVSRRLSIE